MYQHLATGIALYLALAVAVSQDLGDRRSAKRDREIAKVGTVRDGIDREEVVAQVLAALSPDIEIAVAEALASLQSGVDSGSSSSGGSGLSSSSGSGLLSSQGFGLNSSPGSSSSNSGVASSPESGSSFSSSSGLSSTADPSSVGKEPPSLPGAPAQPDSVAGPTARPVYNFAYKVAGEADQTYLAQSEERDGDSLSGVYRYVNPAGALVTVNYNAGPDGFHQTLAQEDGFLNSHQQQASPQLSDTIVSAKSEEENQHYENEHTPGTKLAGNKPPGADTDSVSPVKTSLPTSSAVSPSTTNQALIDEVISALQPDITAAVKAALEKTKPGASSLKVSPVTQQGPAPAAQGRAPIKPRPVPADHRAAPADQRKSPAANRPALVGHRTKQKDHRQEQVDHRPAPANSRPAPAEPRPSGVSQLPTGLGGVASGLSKAGNGNLKVRAGTKISGTGSDEANGDILNTFGSGHFVRIKTPNIDISY